MAGMFKTIRSKGGRYHSKGAISAYANDEGGEYVIKIGNSKSEKTLSFEYVAFKSIALHSWGAARGVTLPAWYENMGGTIEGLKVYYQAIAAVEWHCELVGIKCDALINRDYADHEGFEVVATLRDGRQWQGELIRMGKLIEAHYIRREGAKLARYIKPYDVVNMRLA